MMTYPELKIGDLTAKKPIIQGGMGIGISLSRLAGAVAKAGGVGVISTAQIGFREPDFEEHPVEACRRAIGKELAKARKIAPTGIIGFNIMTALRDYEGHVRAAVEAGADLIISGAGLPLDLPGLAAESQTKIAPIVSTERSAAVILKYWDRKYHRTADLVVIEGPKAGGHLGFSREQLEEYAEYDDKKCAENSYDDEVKKIMTVVRKYGEKYGCHIPVVLAGGISDRASAEHAFGLGADGIQVATRFVTTEECDADIRYKEAYIRANKEDIQIVKSPVGMPGRAIMNPFMERVMAGERISPKKCLLCMKGCKTSEIPYCITESLLHAAKGETDEALLFCGADAWRAEKIETVEEVMDDLLQA